MSRHLDGLPEVVLLGHLHEVIADELTIDGQTVMVRNNGATTRLGAKRDSFAPTSSVFTTKENQDSYQRLEK